MLPDLSGPISNLFYIKLLPSVRRPFLFPKNLKQVIPKILRHFIVLKHFLRILLIFQRAFKQVQGAIILVVDQILKVVLERHSQLIPIVIFSNLELGFFEMVVKVLEAPILLVPRLCASWVLKKNLPRIMTGRLFCSYF